MITKQQIRRLVAKTDTYIADARLSSFRRPLAGVTIRQDIHTAAAYILICPNAYDIDLDPVKAALSLANIKYSQHYKIIYIHPKQLDD